MADEKDDHGRLIEAARAARDRAYAPYSNFKMGAAIQTETGETVPGFLIENISLGLSMCAERVALYSAVTQSAGKPTVLVLHAPKTDGEVTWPCGACLQVAREIAGPDLTIIATNGKEMRTAKLSNLAPSLPGKTNP
ncbi:MAG: cytidine deaminase [Alphaproteobacteria bacterium]|jgi:cytidine deaminase|nr:cytidine deaminase [Alphaproteobacteria bacterium]